MGWAICCDRCGADGQLAQLKKPAERALGAFMQAEGCMVCDLCSFGDFTLGLQHEVAQVDASMHVCIRCVLLISTAMRLKWLEPTTGAS